MNKSSFKNIAIYQNNNNKIITQKIQPSNNKYKVPIPYNKMKKKQNTYLPKKTILQIMVQVLPKERQINQFTKTHKTKATYKTNNKIPLKNIVPSYLTRAENNNYNNNSSTMPNKPSNKLNKKSSKKKRKITIT